MNPQQTFTPNMASVPGLQRRPWIAFASIPVVLAILIGGLVFWNIKVNQNPDTVFRGAFSRALSTKSVYQVVSTVSGSLGVNLDASDVKNPKLSGVLTSTDSGAVVERLEGYGTFSNAYIRHTGGTITKLFVASDVNKWIQIRTNGTASEGAELIGDNILEPQVMFFGNIIFGNFAAKDRGTIMTYITKNPLYTYDKTAVTKDTLDGQKVFIYHVRGNADHLKGYNQLVGKIIGQSTSQLDDQYTQLAEDATMYIGVSSKQLLKVVSDKSDASSATTLYSKYNTTSVGSEPQRQLTWDAFNASSITKLSNSL